MLLSDRDIKASLDSGRIQLDPMDRDLVQPASIDVRLDRLFRLFDNHRYPVIDPAADQSDLTHLVDVGPDQPFVLHPGEFVLGATYGHVTLELSNTATMPILLYPGMKIGQLCFFDLSSPAEYPYGSSGLGSHYQGQRGPTPSRTHERFTRTRIER